MIKMFLFKSKNYKLINQYLNKKFIKVLTYFLLFINGLYIHGWISYVFS